MKNYLIFIVGLVKNSTITIIDRPITRIINKSIHILLEVVVKGDTSGDGEINALDLLQIQKSILGTYTLSGASLKAGDTSGDGVEELTIPVPPASPVLLVNCK